MGNMRELRIRNGWRVEISRTTLKRNPGGATVFSSILLRQQILFVLCGFGELYSASCGEESAA